MPILGGPVFAAPKLYAVSFMPPPLFEVGFSFLFWMGREIFCVSEYCKGGLIFKYAFIVCIDCCMQGFLQ